MSAEQAPRDHLNVAIYSIRILNGAVLGVVLALIPGALFGEICKAILKIAPQQTWLTWILAATNIATSMLGLFVGIFAAQQFKATSVEQGAVGLATMFAGGAVVWKGSAPFTLAGPGDIINIILTAALAVGEVLLLRKVIPAAYALLLVPVSTLLTAGILGRLALPYVKTLTGLMGQGVGALLGLAAPLMVILIAVIFSALVTTPITPVAIALAISLSGIGSGAGNLGVCAAGFGLCLAGWRINPRGLSLAHILGSPKISMPAVMRRPRILLPILASAACCGPFAWLFGIEGTPASAGFGISGLVGPLAYLGLTGWGWWPITKAVVAFVVAPVTFGLLFNWLFVSVLKIVRPEDYRLEIV